MDKFQDKSVYINFALTEQTGGTGADIHTTAIKQADGTYLLNGEKWLISHTDCSDYTYVIAVTDESKEKDDRLSAFVVPNDAPGFEIVPMSHMMGCRGAGHAGLKFTNVKQVSAWRRGPGHGNRHPFAFRLSRPHRVLQPRHGPAHARDLP